jgi:hypothetical protein
MQVKVSKSYLEVSRLVFPLFFKKKRTMKRLSSSDAEGVVFGFLAITAVFSHCAIEAFVNKQIMELRNVSNPVKRLKINNESIIGKIQFLCDSLGIPRIENSEAQLWADFKNQTKKVRNFFIHPKPWEFSVTLQTVMAQITVGKFAETAAKIIGYFFDRTGSRKPTWLRRRNEVFNFIDYKIVP